MASSPHFLSLYYHWLPFLNFSISYMPISPLPLYQICNSKERLEIENINLNVKNVKRYWDYEKWAITTTTGTLCLQDFFTSKKHFNNLMLKFQIGSKSLYSTPRIVFYMYLAVYFSLGYLTTLFNAYVQIYHNIADCIIKCRLCEWMGHF